MSRIAITVSFTERYATTFYSCFRRIIPNIIKNKGEHEFYFILVTDLILDKRSFVDQFKSDFKSMLGNSVQLITKAIDLPDTSAMKAYKEGSQVVIATLQQAGFDVAMQLDADYVWVVEPDVLVPPNALTCMKQMLDFDSGFYDVAMVSYPSQGGGSFLGGRGTPSHPIAEDYSLEELDVPKELLEKIEKLNAEFRACVEKKEKFPEEKGEELRGLMEEAKKCSPLGNVHTLNGKKWRRRGWLENAYPGIGRGSVMPSDWVGLGCTLLSRKALELANFDGYDGKGTQDLFLCWRKWYPMGLKFCVITHVLCDHVIRARKEDGEQDFGELTISTAHHETEGEYIYHPRYYFAPYCKWDGRDKLPVRNKEDPEGETKK